MIKYDNYLRLSALPLPTCATPDCPLDIVLSMNTHNSPYITNRAQILPAGHNSISSGNKEHCRLKISIFLWQWERETDFIFLLLGFKKCLDTFDPSKANSLGPTAGDILV